MDENWSSDKKTEKENPYHKILLDFRKFPLKKFDV